MKVLVSGAGGQLGRALVAAAPAQAEVVPLPRVALDITEPAAVAAALAQHRPALVINAAAYTHVDGAEAQPALAMLGNREGPATLAAAAAAAGVRLLHVSTDFVFDGRASRPYRPDAPVAPLNVYGRSKAEGEVLVRRALPEALIVRTAWLYSAQGPNFVLRMIELMGRCERVEVVADQIGTPTHAARLAEALWALALAGATGIHHYTDAGTASWYDFAVAIREEALAAGVLATAAEIVPVRTEDRAFTTRRPAYSVLDKTTTYAALPTRPPHWRTELRRMLQAMSARHD